MVTEEDFMEAHKELVPSVSADELRHYDRVRKQFEGAGKKEGAETKNGTAAPPLAIEQASSATTAKGKAKAPVHEDETEMVIRTENVQLNGKAGVSGNGLAGGGVDISGGSAASSGGSSKGKGKAPVNHSQGKSSVDIAEGGFGDATQDDDLYS